MNDLDFLSDIPKGIWGILLTLLVYGLTLQIQKRYKSILLNPVILSIAFLIFFLIRFSIPYAAYMKGGRIIDFFMKPAIIALGFPLYQQFEKIKKQWISIVVSQLLGCFIGIISVVAIAKLLGAPKEILLSLVPKSVSTPIALEVSKNLGGIPSLSAAVVILVGLFGALIGFSMMRWLGIKNPISKSLALGNTAHALGTAHAMTISPNYGTFAGLGLIINGILTAFFAPYIVKLLAPLF